MEALLPKDRPFFIAEAGVNHNGDPALALRLVDAAAQAGADAVKFQTFKTDFLVSASAPKARYQEETTGVGGGQREILARLELSIEAHELLIARCRERKILFLSTPFDHESADLLERLGVELFKLGSGEVTNLPLIEHVARKGRPVILSTGMSTMDEVAAAVEVLRRHAADFALLHCVSSYPADPTDANLRAMASMAESFGVPIGFSDHTPGLEVSIAAAALGGRIIEKHFTLDRGLPGPDHRISLDPGELLSLSRALKNAAAALGDGRKAPCQAEEDVRRVARRSLVLARDLEAGALLETGDILCKRPGTGISPARLHEMVGKRLRGAQKADTLLSWGMVE